MSENNETPQFDQIADDDDLIDACDIDLTQDPITDDEIPYVILAGGSEGEEAKQKIEEYGRLFNEGGSNADATVGSSGS